MAATVAADHAEPPLSVYFSGEEGYDPRRVFTFSHSFTDHPLLELPRLKQLAESLYAQGNGQVKFLGQEVTHSSPFEILTEAPVGTTVGGVFDRIHEPGSWIALYEVATDPDYRALIWEVLSSAESQIERSDPGIYKVDAFIFISSPPSLTPFHIDRENNFLLQIHGSKQFSVWNPSDRAAVSEKAIEDFVAHYNLDAVRFEESMLQSSAFNGKLRAGEGVYMPSTSAHMTRTGEEALSEGYSVTMGVVFYTRAIQRAAYSYALNAFLRKLRLSPKPPYESQMRDRYKAALGRMLVQSRRLLRGETMPPGF